MTCCFHPDNEPRPCGRPAEFSDDGCWFCHEHWNLKLQAKRSRQEYRRNSIVSLLSTEEGTARLKTSLSFTMRRRLALGRTPEELIAAMVKNAEENLELSEDYINRATALVNEVLAEIEAEDRS